MAGVSEFPRISSGGLWSHVLYICPSLGSFALPHRSWRRVKAISSIRAVRKPVPACFLKVMLLRSKQGPRTLACHLHFVFLCSPLVIAWWECKRLHFLSQCIFHSLRLSWSTSCGNTSVADSFLYPLSCLFPVAPLLWPTAQEGALPPWPLGPVLPSRMLVCFVWYHGSIRFDSRNRNLLFFFLIACLFFPGYKFNDVYCVTFLKEIKRKYVKSPMNSPL